MDKETVAFIGGILLGGFFMFMCWSFSCFDHHAEILDKEKTLCVHKRNVYKMVPIDEAEIDEAE